MIAAAATPRQIGALPHSRASSDGGRPKRRSSISCPQRGGRGHRGEGGVEGGEVRLPAVDLGGEGRFAGDARGAGGLLGGLEQPQHEFRRQRGVRILRDFVGVEGVGHGSRHFRSAISAAAARFAWC